MTSEVRHEFLADGDAHAIDDQHQHLMLGCQRCDDLIEDAFDRHEFVALRTGGRPIHQQRRELLSLLFSNPSHRFEEPRIRFREFSIRIPRTQTEPRPIDEATFRQMQVRRLRQRLPSGDQRLWSRDRVSSNRETPDRRNA